MKNKNENFDNLVLKISTIDIQIISLYNSIVDLVGALDEKAKKKIPEFGKWQKQCEETARKLLERKDDNNE